MLKLIVDGENPNENSAIYRLQGRNFACFILLAPPKKKRKRKEPHTCYYMSERII